MAITKKNTRFNDSSFFESPEFITSETPYYAVEEDTADPGRIALKFGFLHSQWPLIMAFNSITDPLTELVPGARLIIPSIGDVRNLK